MLAAGSLSNGTTVTHMVNQANVVNYLTKVYGSKNSTEDQDSRSLKGSALIIIDPYNFIILNPKILLCFLLNMLPKCYPTWFIIAQIKANAIKERIEETLNARNLQEISNTTEIEDIDIQDELNAYCTELSGQKDSGYHYTLFWI